MKKKCDQYIQKKKKIYWVSFVYIFLEQFGKSVKLGMILTQTNPNCFCLYISSCFDIKDIQNVFNMIKIY